MMFFAEDKRRENGTFALNCVFIGNEHRKWFFVGMELPGDSPAFESIAIEIYSANLFEREMKEMFGIVPTGNPDDRRLALHEEVWPEGHYPLRKDFNKFNVNGAVSEYRFTKVEGEGIFEVPVGPVHAGIIGPGHFRFSVVGEPIINLDIRLGFTHRGVEKMFEWKKPEEVLNLSECVAGDSAFAHSWAFCHAIEKISGVAVPERAMHLRAVFLELERMYNHVSDIGGIALDVGFSFASAYASIMKESIQALNDKLTGSRFLKGVNVPGGVTKDIRDQKEVLDALKKLSRDLTELKAILFSSVSFMDRVETTGILRKKTAEDFGVVGLAGRASGIAIDLRKNFVHVYAGKGFEMETQVDGDVLARLNVRLDEFEESVRMIGELLAKLPEGNIKADVQFKSGSGLGYAEGWRGPVLYWVRLDHEGKIERCKIVDPSFHNWPGLSYAVLENIVPDFPVCNKSFDLSYPGNDL